MKSSDRRHRMTYLCRKQHNRCYYCGVRVETTKAARKAYRENTGEPCSKATLDHVIPKCAGGSDSLDNLVLACKHCNNVKGAAIPQDGTRQTARRMMQALLHGPHNA